MDVGDCIVAGQSVEVLRVGTSLSTNIGAGIDAERSDSLIVGSASPLPANTSIFFFFASLAFCAASSPTWRMANVKLEGAAPATALGGVSEDVDGDESGFLFSSAFEGFEGWVSVLGALEGVLDGVGAADVVGVPSMGMILTCCFNSPYSFHSSISTRSYSSQRTVFKMK